MIQASPLLIALRSPAGDLLELVKYLALFSGTGRFSMQRLVQLQETA